jgi:hypothetical protein
MGLRCLECTYDGAELYNWPVGGWFAHEAGGRPLRSYLERPQINRLHPSMQDSMIDVRQAVAVHISSSPKVHPRIMHDALRSATTNRVACGVGHSPRNRD